MRWKAWTADSSGLRLFNSLYCTFDVCNLTKKSIKKMFFYCFKYPVIAAIIICLLSTKPTKYRWNSFSCCQLVIHLTTPLTCFFLFFVTDLLLLSYFKTKRDRHHSIEYKHAAETPQHQRSATHDLYNFYLKINKTKLRTHTQSNGLCRVYRQ